MDLNATTLAFGDTLCKSSCVKIRRYWIDRIEAAWRRRSVLWLSGARRAGKTVLSQTLPGVEIFDCELPRIRRLMEDPESFLRGLRGKRIVLDEIHRLANPSELLKIAADHFPTIRVLATGSSTIGASARFRDTLTGRKEELWLTPMIGADLCDFGQGDLDHRLLRGGLPPFFLAAESPERDFQEWMDSYWARDIQELFRIERRASFLRFFEMLLVNSSGIFEATTYSAPCEISRTTVSNYLGVLEATRVAHVIRPFSKRRATEIVSAPKVYAFDTGFVAYHRGWNELRAEDRGALWEHYVLNEIQARAQGRIEIRYWRDKRGHEVDFVLLERGRPPVAVECKWSARAFDPLNFRAFRTVHPSGGNWVVAADVDRPFHRTAGAVSFECLGLEELCLRLDPRRQPPAR